MKKRVRKRATIPGAWLRAARQCAGVTQVELAKRLRTHQPLVSRWEQDELDWTVWLAALSVLGLRRTWTPVKASE